MLVSCRKIRRGSARAAALVCSSPLSFLGGIDMASGKILDEECDSKGLSVSGKVLCFPFGKGSTVGSYAMYQLRLNHLAPAAIVNDSAEPIIVTGAIISDIPMVDGVDVGLLRTGDEVVVDADHGMMEIVGVVERHVVTSIIRSRGKILLLRRSDSVGSYQGHWAGVSGFIEQGETDEQAVRREMDEEIGHNEVRLVSHTETQLFRDHDVVWCVHPFLFEASDPEIRMDWEHREFEWVDPGDMARYETVPGLPAVVGRLLGSAQLSR